MRDTIKLFCQRLDVEEEYMHSNARHPDKGSDKITEKWNKIKDIASYE